jgi:LCP family protein required for cell wall assembly
VLLALVGLLFAAVAGWAAYANSQISAIPRMKLDLDTDFGGSEELAQYERPSAPSGKAAGSVNILVAGVDAGESSRIARDLESGAWEPGSHRSDVIMVIHISADRRQAYVISVPRDSWVSIPGYGMSKINAALSYGGPPLFVRTVEEFTSLRMDHLAIVEWAGFKKLVDALGGVAIEGAKGTTTLDGEQALTYVRERYDLPRGDLDRIQRQQNVVRALSEQMVSRGVLLNPVKLTEVLKAVTSSIALDESFTDAEIRELALSLRSLRSGDVTQLTVPLAGYDRIDGQSVVLVDEGESKELFGAVMSDELDEYVTTHEVDMLPVATDVD